MAVPKRGFTDKHLDRADCPTALTERLLDHPTDLMMMEAYNIVVGILCSDNEALIRTSILILEYTFVTFFRVFFMFQ